MSYQKTLTKEEILEHLAIYVAELLPQNIIGKIKIAYNDEDGVDIIIIPSVVDKILN